MRVLIACECSGIVRTAFRLRGHSAYSADMSPAEDNSEFHICGDVRLVLGDGWDLMIAHPPCKYLSVSGMHWTTRGLRDPQHTIDAIAFAETLWLAPIPKICIENPVGVLSTRSVLGKSHDVLQPHKFGHDASKGTRLWLKDLPPLLKTGPHIPPRVVIDANGKAHKRWGNQTDSGQNKLAPSDHRSADRARTYVGIAKAMAEQWG